MCAAVNLSTRLDKRYYLLRVSSQNFHRVAQRVDEGVECVAALSDLLGFTKCISDLLVLVDAHV